MISPEIMSRVNDTISRGFEIPMEKLTPEANLFTDLGLDSLDAIDMLVYLEEEIKIKVDGERLMGVRTMQDVYNLVHELKQKA
jgi:acyl carrier protein